jgi:hypothetical protein
MRRIMFTCFACGDRFKKVQALRGHLRHCEHHRQKAQAKAQLKGQPPGKLQSKQSQSNSFVQGDNQKALGRRFGGDSQENLMLLLDVYEVLPELKRKCLDYAAIARLLANVRPGMTTAEEWVSLYWIIDEYERGYEQMVMQFHLNRMVLELYRQMSVVKKTWLNNLFNDFNKQTGYASEEMSEKAMFALDEEEKMWNTIMTNIKKMLVASH